MLRNRLEAGLKQTGATIIAEGVSRLPNTTLFTAPGLNAETAVIGFDLEGIAVERSAKSEGVTSLVGELADLVVAKGEAAVAEREKEIEDLKLTTKENLELGQVVRFEAGAGNILDSYLHIQDGRGVNAVLVELAGGSKELAHDLAVHIAFAKPPYLTRDEVPADDVEKERQALLEITKAEGKPEQAWPKIVEGRLNGWFKERVLLEQNFVRDEKKTIAQLLGDAEIVRFAQVYIGS